ncbi:MAG: hypothetical protein KY462_09255 [Actinobacteria bacterium]|nr:hypothetical protein [Actinomycetota bacterium]
MTKTPHRRPRHVETLFTALSAKVAAGAVSAVTAAGLLASATGQLPDAMQDGLSEAAARVGISVPAGSQDQPLNTTDQRNTEEGQHRGARQPGRRDPRARRRRPQQHR